VAPEAAEAKESSEAQSTSTVPVTEVVEESGMGPNTHAAPAESHEDKVEGSGLGCSICTEDFTKGEDVRVLPCNHKYHPACIDPWLLNVSGTCPLCRVDLRPVATNTSATSPTADAADLPPPLTEGDAGEQEASTQRGRAARVLDMAHMRHAPAHERIAALRQLRMEQNQRDISGNPSDVEVAGTEQSRGARLTNRLRDVFRIRTRPEAAPEEVERASTSPVDPSAARIVGAPRVIYNRR